MKRIITLLVACCLYLVADAQLPSGYEPQTKRVQLIGAKMDSVFTIPRFCGTPRFPTRAWVADGAIGLDTCNNMFYIYIDAAWVRMATYNEIPALGDTLGWNIGGNDLTTFSRQSYLGTINNDHLKIITNNTERVIIPATGITRQSSAVYKYLLYDTTGKHLGYGDALLPTDTTNKWVNLITRTPGKDSIIFYIGSTRYAIKDSTGGGGTWGSITGTLTAQTDLYDSLLARLRITDTAAMLLNYRHWLAGYLHISDTAAMLTNYRHWLAGYLTSIDTGNISNFHVKVRSLFSVGAGLSYNSATGHFANTLPMVYPGAGIALSTGSAWGTSITDNSANWNTAFGWGNHASAGYVPGSRTISTTYPLAGGGDLSTNRTLTLDTATGKWRSEGYYDTKYLTEQNWLFEADQPYRFWQGVAVGSQGIFTFSDRDSVFVLSNTIQQY
ncbi:MAG: hypothetical protein ABL876_17640, partial [Chitinophagaceae bacterium]